MCPSQQSNPRIVSFQRVVISTWWAKTMVWKKNTMRLFYTKKSSSECTFWNQLLVLHHWTSIWIRSLMKKKIISGFSRGQNALITWCIECITLNPFGVKCTFPVTGLLHCCNAMMRWAPGSQEEEQNSSYAHCLLAGEGQPLKCNSGAARSSNVVLRLLLLLLLLLL